jgi:pyrroloquinoline quinone biosynthesis protein D
MTQLISLESKPALSNLFRMQWEESQQAWVLLYPEGMVRLNPPAAEILRRCTGAATVAEIIAELQSAFGERDLQSDVLEFLGVADGKGWIK